MSALTHVTVHSSAFPKALDDQLLRCLEARKIDPKFHYLTHKQAAKWLALHEAYSPARSDANCIAIYDQSFAAAAKILAGKSIELISLGCGGGQKDARLAQMLATQGGAVSYTPSDISVALVLTSMQTVQTVAPKIPIRPLVCDLSTAENLAADLSCEWDANAIRLWGFFGMIPNFEPELILPKLAALLRPNDLLLFSANLAPGSDYAAGVRQVFSGYENPLTTDWLSTLLQDLGLEQGGGFVKYSIEETQDGLLRIAADFIFQSAQKISLQGRPFQFSQGDKIRLFFSYRYTPERIANWLSKYGLEIAGQWIADSDEEGVFLIRRSLVK